jgi:hypothetical protein
MRSEGGNRSPLEFIERLAIALWILKLVDEVQLTEVERKKVRHFALHFIEGLPDPHDAGPTDSGVGSR